MHGNLCLIPTFSLWEIGQTSLSLITALTAMPVPLHKQEAQTGTVHEGDYFWILPIILDTPTTFFQWDSQKCGFKSFQLNRIYMANTLSTTWKFGAEKVPTSLCDSPKTVNLKSDCWNSHQEPETACSENITNQLVMFLFYLIQGFLFRTKHSIAFLS